MKKLISLMLVLMLSVCFAAVAQADLLSDIQAKGEIVIAAEGCWSPWTYTDDNGEMVGFDMDVGRRIGEKLGVKVTFVPCEWDGLFAGLDNGRFDMVINSVDITEERQEKFDFSIPYVAEHMVVITRADNTEINSFEDLAGKTTANTLASSYSLEAEKYGATPLGVDDFNQTIELVLTGRIDATLNDESALADYMANHPDAPLKVAARSEEGALKGILLKKGENSASLLVIVNEVVEEMIADGSMEALSMQYFGAYNPIK